MSANRVADPVEDGLIGAALFAVIVVGVLAWFGKLPGTPWPAATENAPTYGWLDAQGNPPPQALLDELGGAALRDQPYSKYPLTKAKAALYAQGYEFRVVGGGER